MLVAVVAVMLVTGRLCGRLDIGLQPVGKPLAERCIFIKFRVICRHKKYLLSGCRTPCRLVVSCTMPCCRYQEAFPDKIRLRRLPGNVILMMRCSKCCCAGGYGTCAGVWGCQSPYAAVFLHFCVI